MKNRLELSLIEGATPEGYCKSFPVPPGGRIRLATGDAEQTADGTAIAFVDLTLANRGVNFSDVRVRFLVVDDEGCEEELDPSYFGVEFVDQSFTHHTRVITLPAHARVFADIEHRGNVNNLDAALVNLNP